jgi:putative ABC transport system permease protein
VLDSGGRGSGPAVGGPLRATLTVAQIACAVPLVIAAALLLRNLWMLSHLDPGFNPDPIVTARISASGSRCETTERCLAFFRDVDDQSRTAPGVSGAALVNTLPLTGAVAKRSLEIEGFAVAAGRTAPLFWLHVITPAYFDVMNMQVASGRAFAREDQIGPPVAIVTAATARRFWDRENPIGQRVRFVGTNQWHTVVGVIADVRAYDMTRDVPNWIDGTIYVPYGPYATMEDGRVPTDMTLTLRTTLAGARVEAMLQQLAAGLGGDTVIGDVRPMRSILADAVAAPTATTSLLVTMAGLALVLGCIGVYGVLSFLVSRQTRDLGIRVALGAERRDVFWLVIKEGASLCGGGIVLGIAGSFALTRWLSSELHGVSPLDPATYVAVAVVMATVTLTACYVPTRRAMSIDPLTALRDQ